MSNLLFFLPDEALLFIAVVVGIAVVAGVVRPRVLLAVFLLLLISPLLGPLFELALEAMPFWLVLLIGAAAAMALLRAVFVILIGRHATDEMVGNLAASAVKGLFRLTFAPVRWVFSGGRGR